jgi:hypothetical protein
MERLKDIPIHFNYLFADSEADFRSFMKPYQECFERADEEWLEEAVALYKAFKNRERVFAEGSNLIPAGYKYVTVGYDPYDLYFHNVDNLEEIVLIEG